MDFLDPAKRRSHLIRLYIGYGLIAFAIALAAIVLVSISYGYDYDRKHGGVIQNGLVFIASRPVSADIYLNGQKERSGTDTRLVLPANKYNMELRAKGYRDWKRVFTLQGGKVVRMDYPLLIPENLTQEELQLYASVPGFMSQSPNGRWVVMQQPGSVLGFDLFDLDQESPLANPFSLPVSVVNQTPGDHSYQIVEWSDNNRHVLVLHNFNNGREFILIDREQPALSVNVSSVFNLPGASFTMRNKNFDQYYVHEATAGTLGIGQLNTATVIPLLQKVAAYDSLGNDAILYSSPVESGLNVRLKVADRDLLIKNYSTATQPMLDITRYENDLYVAVGSEEEKRTLVYKDPMRYYEDPLNRSPIAAISLRLNEAPQMVSFSPHGQFLMMQSGQKFVFYDAYTENQTRYELSLPLDDGAVVDWVDGFHLSGVSGGKTLLFNYDGANETLLTEQSPGAKAFYNIGRSMHFTLAPSKVVSGRPAWSQTSLRVER